MTARWVRERTLHTIYTLRDAAGEVLYIGCTAYWPGRLSAHRRKEWWHLVDSIETEEVYGRSPATLRELELIHLHEPPHNDQGTEKARERAREQWRARKAAQGADA
jgi:hypothetical protein